MKEIKRWFLEKLKRFSEPWLHRKSYAIKNIIKGFLLGINPFIHVLFIKNITEVIDGGNYEDFIQIFMYYVWYIILYEIILVSIHKWWWYDWVPQYVSYLHNKYLKKYVLLDNNEIERVWTGRTISIYDKWVDNWAMVVDMFLFYTSSFIITLVFAFVMIMQIHFIAAIWFMLVYFFTIYINLKLNNKILGIRSKRENERAFQMQWIVRIIMSKIEILQNNKINREVEKVDYHTIKSQEYNLQMAPYFHWFFHLPQLIMYVVKLILLFVLGKMIIEWNMWIATFVSIFGVMLILESSIVKFVEFFKNSTKMFASVYKLWDFFDGTPNIQWYNEWKDFEYKTWNIEVKNMSFAYWENSQMYSKTLICILLDEKLLLLFEIVEVEKQPL